MNFDKANIGNIAMHSFFEIMLFSENYEFFNILKCSQNPAFQKWNKIDVQRNDDIN